MLTAEGDESPHVTDKPRIRLREVPIQPVPFGVMAVGVVVPALGAAHFVTHVEHGHTLADE